ncbi:MAG: hypothetical protein KY475_21810, partial [Planctomycetes bacterium]|nr:hypothetical protein [Planctomycetota bacterium]
MDDLHLPVWSAAAERTSSTRRLRRPCRKFAFVGIITCFGIFVLWRTAVYERLVIVGATGAVGRLVLRMLEEREFPCESITFLASQRSAGKTVTFKGAEHPVEVLRPESFREG